MTAERIGDQEMREIVVLLVFMMVVAHPLAKTKDGATPKEENVCDTLRGKTPGLFGLCVAYCEASDLDSATATDGFTKVAERQDRFLQKYNRKKTAADPEMPCLSQNACPCWSTNAISAARWLDMSVPATCATFAAENVSFDMLATTGTYADPEFNSLSVTKHTPDGVNFNHYCQNVDNATNTYMFHQFDATDFEVCRAQILGTCAVLGF